MLGIYKITNIINNKFYIGSSINIFKRWLEHKDALIRNVHHCTYLQNSVNKYGIDNFIFEILEELIFPEGYERSLIREHLIQREQYYLDSLVPDYNFYKIADSPKGYKDSLQTLKKKSISQLKNWNNNEIRRSQVSKANKNKIISEETRAKISMRNKDKPKSEEHRKKIGLANAKAILQYSIEGIFIQEFPTLTKASREIGVSIASISSALNRKNGTSGKFKWKYKYEKIKK